MMDCSVSNTLVKPFPRAYGEIADGTRSLISADVFEITI